MSISLKGQWLENADNMFSPPTRVTILTMSLPAPHFTLSSEPCRVFQGADLGRSTAKICRSEDATLIPHIWAEEGPKGSFANKPNSDSSFFQVF